MHAQRQDNGTGAERAQQDEITDRIAEIAESRAAIEQAKGMLMFIFGIGTDEAFNVLRMQSQHHNVKLRALAEQIIRDLVAASRQRLPVDRVLFDNLVHTAYTRMEQPLLTDVVEQMSRTSPGREPRSS
ncbi:MAG: antitermination regulator [Mycobacterium sp.]|jgi:hypothetical protein|nr:antitermination regulator [Mycobacterium sp.]MDT5181113.1 hypothetical protein [Mycobacterium sp.]